ncbi:MAG: hypothetical protein KDK34_09720 [Leptospiraceae bacterium]|nr:hypothetical protein [Leptospiraceae bacterium]
MRKVLQLAVSLILACVALPGCEPEVHGSFAWSSTDDRDVMEPERSLLVETEFRIQRERLYFYDYETIWWVYQIQSGYYDENEFLAALYENNLTPDPVLVDLRRVELLEDGCCDYIRQFYEELPPGRYLLNIAHQSNVVDSVEFQVIPPEGPAMIHGNDFENLDDEPDQGAEVDELLRFSS